MKSSSELDQIAPALVALQRECPSVKKDSNNPHFRSKYASLDSILEVVKPIATAHGIAIIQGDPVETIDGKFCVGTRLLHHSGQWVENSFAMPIEKQNPQGAGSAITYGRRYSLGAILAIATDDDDDANHASGKAKPAAKPAPNQYDSFVNSRRLALKDAKLDSSTPEGEALGKKLNALFKTIATAAGAPGHPNEQTPTQFAECMLEWTAQAKDLISGAAAHSSAEAAA